EYTYNGQLGAIYNKEKTTFRVWAPLASELTLNLYNQGHPNYDRLGNPNQELLPYETHDFVKIENGAWEVEVDGDLDAKYYTFTVTNYDITSEVTDPYSYSTGANGL